MPVTRRLFLGAAASVGFAKVGTAGILMPVRSLLSIGDDEYQTYYDHDVTVPGEPNPWGVVSTFTRVTFRSASRIVTLPYVPAARATLNGNGAFVFDVITSEGRPVRVRKPEVLLPPRCFPVSFKGEGHV